LIDLYSCISVLTTEIWTVHVLSEIKQFFLRGVASWMNRYAPVEHP